MIIEYCGAMNAPKNYIDVDFVEVKTVKKNAEIARKILATVKEAVEGIVFTAIMFTIIYGFSFLDLLTR
jgi:hypothetical protein